ncbi:MAG: hypothetical protein GX638_07910, partial [Crenarchaeota archaeon]|nr:hypothetical protein [Thermoproteota archaeon]
KGAIIENSAIMDRAIIGENAQIHDSIIGRHTTISSSVTEPTKICDISVIGDDVYIYAGSNLSCTKIYPHQHVRGYFKNQLIQSSI